MSETPRNCLFETESITKSVGIYISQKAFNVKCNYHINMDYAKLMDNYVDHIIKDSKMSESQNKLFNGESYSEIKTNLTNDFDKNTNHSLITYLEKCMDLQDIKDIVNVFIITKIVSKLCYKKQYPTKYVNQCINACSDQKLISIIMIRGSWDEIAKFIRNKIPMATISGKKYTDVIMREAGIFAVFVFVGICGYLYLSRDKDAS